MTELLAFMAQILATQVANGQKTSAATVEPLLPPVEAWLRTCGVPIDPSSTEDTTHWLTSFDRATEQARIIGIGEATHGTHEFALLRDRIVRHLVSQRGFTCVAVEASYFYVRRLNAYVLRGDGELASALAGLGFWMWDTEEVTSLFQWIREYNRQVPEARQVEICGVDPHGTHGALDSLNHYQQPSAYAANALATADGNYLARVVAQDTTSEGKPALRDQYMAENLEHLLATHGHNTRMIFLAHNGHVGCFPYGLGVRPTGSYLKERFGSESYALGQGFARGTFQARDLTADGSLRIIKVDSLARYSVDWCIMQAGMNDFFIDLRSAPQQGPVAKWLATSLLMRSCGAGYVGEFWTWSAVRLKETFDGLAYFAETTSSHSTATGVRGTLK